jgi:hypothetical protein
MKRSLCLFLLIFGSLLVYAQAPLLERKISVSISNERLDDALRKISKAGDFVFSYNPAILDGARMISFTFVDRSIREVLDELFEGSVRYKARGGYIILTAGTPPAAKEPALVTGYVVDETTGERLKDVSVYDPVTLTSTLTDTYGYFEIKIDKPSPELILSVNRQDYSDTVFMVPSRQRLLNIPIKFEKERISVLADSVGRKLERFWKKKALWFENMNIRNIDDTLYRRSQVSFVPFIGSNLRMSAHVINDYSFNILGGYSLGVRKLEFGGLFNLVRGDMRGVQLSGVLNSIGGETNGLQFAGVLNSNLGITRGMQFAGAMNLNVSGAEGAQFSGVANITAGLQNGPQVAGVFNIASDDSRHLQLAGVYNIAAKNMDGLQSAGVFNITGKNIRGAQLAGVMNLSGKDVKGIQIAGVLNYARKVKGVQIGLINIADSVKGIPIGLMSLVWKGYHKIEISADEIFYNNLSFRTGVPAFYNIFTVGAKPSSYKEDETVWTFGYGVGTAPRLSRKLYLNLDVTANQIVWGNSIETLNLLNKAYVGFDFQAFKKMSLAFGATLNGYITKNQADAHPSLFTDYHPDIFYNRDIGSDYNMKMWLGGKVALRFL